MLPEVLLFQLFVDKKNFNIQGDSLARGPKLLSTKNYVIEIIT